MEVEIFLRHAVDLFGQLRAHPVGHFQRDAGHDIVLDEAEEGAGAVDTRQNDADFCDGPEVNAGDKPVGHQSGNLSDPVRAEDGQDGAERGEDQRQQDDAEALAHILRQAAQRALEIGFLIGLHVGSHFCVPPSSSSAALSWDMAISR